MGAEFLDETTIERPAPPARVMKPAGAGVSAPGNTASRGAQVANGRHEPADLAHIEMEAAARPPGEVTPLRRAVENLELARTLGIPGDKDHAIEGLLGLFRRWNGPMLDVLGEVHRRGELGLERYGRWQPERDTRDYGAERNAEIFDALFYAAQQAVTR